MKAVVSEDERHFYGHRGRLVMEEFLDVSELGWWKDGVDRAVLQWGDRRSSSPTAPERELNDRTGTRERLRIYRPAANKARANA
jgi:hypothetical protein